MAVDLTGLIAPRLAALEAAGLRRQLRSGTADLIDVSSNDYLGLARHPLVIERACAWTRQYGAGSRASRLVCGTWPQLAALEARLAAFKGADAALIFSSGFLLNSTVLPALLELARHPVVFTDRLIHASLHAGLARVKQIRFRHNDLAHLEELLTLHHGDLRLIVTESVFSMDGDCADVPALVALAEKHDALLYLDEAHATGVLGPQGKGLAALVPGRVPIVMGTLGKALGSAGAYVAGSRALIDWLINRCAGFIYSTAPAPAALGAAEAALELIPTLEAERARLTRMAEALRRALYAKGIDTLASTTHIVPAVFGSTQKALAAAQRLRDANILAVAIRPPTVPPGSARVRFSLSAALSDAKFEQLLKAVTAL